MLTKEQANEWFSKTTELSKFKVHKPLVSEIIEQTSFLPESTSLPQRLWHIMHDTTVVPTCKMCQTHVSWDRRHKLYKTYCGSPKCVNNDPDIVTKKKSNSNYEVQKRKRQQTNIDRYGHTNFLASDQGRKQITQTNIERYGVESIMLVPEIKEKAKQTILERYGVDNVFELQTYQDQANRQKEKLYGTKTYNNRTKASTTNKGKYGVPNPAQQHMIDILPQIGDYDWLYDQYINQNKTAIQLASELGVADSTIGYHLKKQGIAIKYNNHYSHKCIQWLTSIMEDKGITIQHALNGGEYLIPGTKYKADGYCSETNTIYEFYGDYWHGNPDLYDGSVINKVIGVSMDKLYRATIERENFLRSQGYKMVTMWESDFVGKI